MKGLLTSSPRRLAGGVQAQEAEMKLLDRQKLEAVNRARSNSARHVTPLLADVRGLILGAREQVARAVDSGLVTYPSEKLQGHRPASKPAQGNALGNGMAYASALKGRKNALSASMISVVPPLQGLCVLRTNTQGAALGWFVAAPLALDQAARKKCMKRFSEKLLRHMVRFAEVVPDEQIVAALRRQLGWTHFKFIIYLDDELKRDFCAEMCRIEKWSTRTLEKKIGGMLFERTALSKN
jgi:hypothetical protein